MLASIAATRAAALATSCSSPMPASRRTCRQPQRLPLVGEAALGDRELLLQAAQLEVVARDLRGHAHPHVVERRVERCRPSPPPRAPRSGPGRTGRSPRTRRSRRDRWRSAIGSSVKPGIDLLAAIDRRAHRRPSDTDRSVDIVEDRARLVDPRDGDPHVVIRCSAAVSSCSRTGSSNCRHHRGSYGCCDDERRIGVRQRRRSRLGRAGTAFAQRRRASATARDHAATITRTTTCTIIAPPAAAAGAAALDALTPRARSRSTTRANRHVEHRREEQAEERHAEHAGEHRDAHRLPHLGAGARREHQRHDAHDERDRRHQDRPQPDAARLEHRLRRGARLRPRAACANSTIRIAFLQARPTSTRKPICVKTLLSPPVSHTPAIARQQRHRHDQDHAERQRPALVLRRQHEVDRAARTAGRSAASCCRRASSW